MTIWNIHPSASGDDLICESASDFVDRLINLSDFLYQVTNESVFLDMDFIYRGHSDSSFRLLPTSLRSSQEDQKSYDLLWEGLNCISSDLI